MAMGVGMRLGAMGSGRVIVPMVLVVDVAMVVLERFMLVQVIVTLRQVEP